MTSTSIRLITLAVTFLLGSCTQLQTGDGKLNPDTGSAAKSHAPANVIFFIGDGMGMDTVTAARIFKGQLQGLPGEDHELAFERLPYTALSKVYNTNQQVPDSAGTATAMLSGVKTLAGVIGVGPGVTRGDCDSVRGNELATLLDIAEQQGRATGLVSTARITHATPATAYAHSADRGWENNAAIPEDHKACKDIAAQLIEYDDGDGPDVILGGGLAQFIPVVKGGKRTDERDLVQEWLARNSDTGVFIQTGSGLSNLREPANAKILGLFTPSHMSFDIDRKKNNLDEPSLTEMTLAALEHLQASNSGYFLFVEAGRIDHAHHAGNAARALLETVELSNAVAAVLERVSLDDTLIVVTADHGHTFGMGGYATRGNPILGFVKENDRSGKPNAELATDIEDNPYTTVGYLNGPGYQAHQEGTIDKSNPEALDYLQNAGVGLKWSETHSGTDVVFYAGGPGADRVRGVMEQNTIFPIMLDALGLKE